MARQVWKINKFEGGLNDYSDPKDIRANEFSNIEDVYISKAGSISPLGHALNNVTDIDKLNLTGTSADLIAGKGFLWYRSDSSYETIPTIGTTITKTSSSAASDGQKARMIFTIDTLVWLFYHTDNYYELDTLLDDMHAHNDDSLKLQLYYGSGSSWTKLLGGSAEVALTWQNKDDSDAGNGAGWFNDKTMNAARTAEGTEDYYVTEPAFSDENLWKPTDYGLPFTVWGYYIPGDNGDYGPQTEGNTEHLFYKRPSSQWLANNKNAWFKTLGNHNTAEATHQPRTAIGLYKFGGFTSVDFDYDDMPENISSSAIYRPQHSGQHSAEMHYRNVRASLLYNIKTKINAYSGTSGVVAKWPDGNVGGPGGQDMLELESTAVGTAKNGNELRMAFTSSWGTTTNSRQEDQTYNSGTTTWTDIGGIKSILSSADAIASTGQWENHENGFIGSGDRYFSGGEAVDDDIYKIEFGGTVNSGDIIKLTISPLGANVTETTFEIINNYSSHSDLAEAFETVIDAASCGVTATHTGSNDYLLIDGGTGTANSFIVQCEVLPHDLTTQSYLQGITENQAILLSKTGTLSTGSSTNYKTAFRVYSGGSGSWLDDWSNENSSNFFDWIYTSSDENSPVMINEGNRVRICDGNFNLNNKNKWFGFIDNTDFFPNPDSDDASHNGFSFITSTYGFFLENNDKKWLYTENSTNNPGWSNPSKMGVRILANTSINASYASDEAEMTFKIYTATDTGGLDWGGKIKVYANVVYDDNSESLLGHQFKFGSSYELDCSTANTSVNIQCSIRPQNSLGEYLFNDKRIVGVRLYYTHSDDEYEIFYDLGLCHFADGFIRATETYTLDDTTGNTNRYVWSDTAQNGVSVSLYDLTAGTNVITYNTRPQIDDYTENNLRTVYGKHSPQTLNPRYKTSCMAGERLFVGNLRLDIGDKTIYKNDGVLFSPPGQLDILPYPTNLLELNIGDGDEIIKLISAEDRILQFKKHFLYILDITSKLSSDWALSGRHQFKGILNPEAVCETVDGIFWVNKYGAYMYKDDKIKDLFLRIKDEGAKQNTQRINSETWSDFISSDTICGVNPKSREVFVIKKSTQTTPSDGDCYVYNLITDSWVKGKNKFWTGSGTAGTGIMTNIQNIGDNSTLGYMVGTTPGMTKVPSGESNDPGGPL